MRTRLRQSRERALEAMLQTRTHAWEEVGLSRQLGRAAVRRARREALVLLPLLVGVLIVYAERESLFGRDLDWESAGTEQIAPLQTPVPVYITYLTAMPAADGSSVTFSDDVYGRDAARLATLQSSAGTAASASR